MSEDPDYPDIPPVDFDVPRTSRQGPPYYFGILGDVEAPDYPPTKLPGTTPPSPLPRGDEDLPRLQQSRSSPWVDVGAGYVESPSVREPRAPAYTFRPSTSLGGLLAGLLGLGQDVDMAVQGPPHDGEFEDSEGFTDISPEWQTPAAPAYTFVPAQQPPPPPPPPKTYTLLHVPARPAIDVTATDTTEEPGPTLSGLSNEQGWRYRRAGSLLGLGESVFVVHRIER